LTSQLRKDWNETGNALFGFHPVGNPIFGPS